MPPTRSNKLTYEDYLRFPEDGKRHELISGEHFVSPTANLRHQRILGNLYWHLRGFLRQDPVGALYAAPFEVVMSDHDVVQPDLTFISKESTDLPTELKFRGVPDLVVEILSSRTRKLDERVKFKRYEHFGVEEYWIVDPELKGMKVFRQTESGFARFAELNLEQQDLLRTPLLPSFSLPLSNILED